MRRLVIALLLPLLLLPTAVFAENGEDAGVSEELEEEVARQIGGLELGAWEEYSAALSEALGFTPLSPARLLELIAEGAAEDAPRSLLDAIKRIGLAELKNAAAPIALLTLSALLTSLSGVAAGGRMKELLSFLLCGVSLTVTAGLVSSLAGRAAETVEKAGELASKSAPILTALLISSGSASGAAAFSPLMGLLAETVILAIERFLLPAALAAGVLAMLDPLSGGGKLRRLTALLRFAVKWGLGLLTTFFVGSAAVTGMTAASRDGVTVRTARYALDKLIPIVGSMVSGTVDSVMSCGLLIRNGAGIMTLLILILSAAEPLIVLAAGIFVFRAAAALSAPAADPAAVELLSGAADTAELLFACAAAACCMLAFVCFMFVSSGGAAAGLW